MNTLNDSDFANLKALHASVRDALRAAHKEHGEEHRYAILASAFLRGRAYRRHERSHHSTTNMDGSRFEHHLPNRAKLYRVIAQHLTVIPHDPLGAIPLQRLDRLARETAIAAWLADPSGAIAAPVRVKKAPTRDGLPVAAE